MVPATEIAVLPLVVGAQIEDPSTSAGEVWKSTIDTVLSQDGAQRAYWGRQVENPSVLDFLVGRHHLVKPQEPQLIKPTRVDWDDVQAHKNFIASPAYGPFVKHLMTIIDVDTAISHPNIDKTISMNHANFEPHPPSAAIGRAPVTERLTLYFSADISEADIKSWDQKIKKILKVVEENAGEAFKGASAGWVVEEVDRDGVKGKAKALTGVIGWESVEAHIAFTGHPSFKENIGLLREGMAESEMHHVKFEET